MEKACLEVIIEIVSMPLAMSSCRRLTLGFRRDLAPEPLG